MTVNTLAGKRPPVYSDGLQVSDWLLKHHCSGIRHVLEAGRIGEIYNIGDWNESASLNVVNALCTILDDLQPRSDGRRYVQKITFAKDRPEHECHYAIDATKIARTQLEAYRNFRSRHPQDHAVVSAEPRSVPRRAMGRIPRVSQQKLHAVS